MPVIKTWLVPEMREAQFEELYDDLWRAVERVPELGFNKKKPEDITFLFPKDQMVKEMGRMVPIGAKLKISNFDKTVIGKLPDDGVKLEFDDKSNLLIRPSGTEPIIKVYAESPLSAKDSDALKTYGLKWVRETFTSPR